MDVKCDIALPSSTQNDIDEAKAKKLVETDAMQLVKALTCLAQTKQLSTSCPRAFSLVLLRQLTLAELLLPLWKCPRTA